MTWHLVVADGQGDRGGMQTEDEDADIEAALDTDVEMTVGETLRRRKVSKDKRSISKRFGGGAGGKVGLGLARGHSHQSQRRVSSIAESGGVRVPGVGGVGVGVGLGAGGGGGGGGGSSSASRSHHKRRPRRHSTPGFTLSDGDSDGHKREKLQQRLEAMRRLPRSSRFASQQIDIITKALGILGGRGNGAAARTSNENDELSRLIAAISL